MREAVGCIAGEVWSGAALVASVRFGGGMAGASGQRGARRLAFGNSHSPTRMKRPLHRVLRTAPSAVAPALAAFRFLAPVVVPAPVLALGGLALLAALPTVARAQTDTDIFLVTMERTGAGVALVGAPVAVTDRAGYDNQPAFLPDGSALLYTSLRGDQADSYRYDLSSGQATRLTRSPESEYSPTPIPGRDRFSAVRVEADSAQRLWSFAYDGGDPRLVLETVEPVGYHAWATPERVALFVLGDPPTLRLADTGTGKAEVVAEGIGRSLQPVPGRTAVSFTQELDGVWWIRELDVASGALRRIVRMLGPDEYHAWLPDGTLLTAHGSRIYQLDAGAAGGAGAAGAAGQAAGEWRQVADLSRFGLEAVSRLAVSPDGSRLAVVVERPAPEPAGTAGLPTGDGSLVAFASVVFGSLLAMINPLGALTIFVGLTAGYSARHRRLTALWACVTAAAILLVFAIFGTAILRFFGITTYAFRIAGGILFFAIGWDMLQARRSRSKTTPEEEEESASRHEVAVVPLGMPTLAGPGAITTVIALMGQAEGAVETGVIYVGIAAVLVTSLLVLLAAPLILRFLGQIGINVVTRLMGLLVMVVGVQFVLDGLRTVVLEILG